MYKDFILATNLNFKTEEYIIKVNKKDLTSLIQRSVGKHFVV